MVCQCRPAIYNLHTCGGRTEQRPIRRCETGNMRIDLAEARRDHAQAQANLNMVILSNAQADQHGQPRPYTHDQVAWYQTEAREAQAEVTQLNTAMARARACTGLAETPVYLNHETHCGGFDMDGNHWQGH